MRTSGFALVALLAALAAAPVSAQDEAPAHFTAAQAARGADTYRDRCVLCHGANLDDGEWGPTLKGARFKRKWGGQSMAALFAYVSTTMPPGQTALMGPEDYADVLAHMLAGNGVAAGDKPLPSNTEALGPLTMPK
jgi:mono/diheme cytochrome c family protein